VSEAIWTVEESSTRVVDAPPKQSIPPTVLSEFGRRQGRKLIYVTKRFTWLTKIPDLFALLLRETMCQVLICQVPRA
jgi:hypothetical protein